MLRTAGPTWALIVGMVLSGCTDKADTGRDSGSLDGGAGDSGADGGDSGGPTDVTVSVSLDATVMDECRSTCGTLSVSGDGWLGDVRWQVESDIDGFLPVEGTLDGDGQATFCIDGPLTPGVHNLAFHVDIGDRTYALATLDVRPFGWAYGLDKPVEVLTEPPWVPHIPESDLRVDPAFPSSNVTYPDPDGGDERVPAVSVLAPSTVVFNGRRFLYYAGTPDTTFYLGVASTRGEGENGWVIENDGDYILHSSQTGTRKGDWDYYAQNTPEALIRDDEIWLYYNGRSGESGGLTIGLATSTDGVHFDRNPTPVLEPTGVPGDFDEGGVAHPSVEVRDVDFTDNEAGASEVFEMWYASGTLEIGYAISADGLNFERYCDGSVFAGKLGTWDLGTVKAPEVKRYEDTYYMTYSGCGQGCYQVGWAASNDGIRWIQHTEPIIPIQQPEPGSSEIPWNSYGTQEGFIEDDDSGIWRIWYAGTSTSGGDIGYVEVTPR
ncbi:MAG: hypothetical protein D6798_09115 [Deltaproteobacteria bacterium]|nr:MAG: hypothetical protein D6798_09115 [Deltaproteobacteria bacterium]